ncbi:MAG: mandelate racemase [Afipia felis]|nr:mandelate racemase [Afipia felis]
MNQPSMPPSTDRPAHDVPNITGIVVRGVVAPMQRPLRTASGVMSSAPLVLVDIAASDGVVGHSYAFAYTPVVLTSLTRLTADISELLEDKPLQPQVLMQALRARFVLIGSRGLIDMALAALDIALWDAYARHLKQPLVRLLGGAPIDLPAYASFGMDGLEDAVGFTTEAVAQGFGAVKIKVGYEDFADDLAVIRAVKRTIGDAALLIDYNQSLNLPEAIRRGCALDDEGLTWIEEPTAYDDTTGHAKIAAGIRTPLQLGENLWGPQDIAESIRLGASDLMMPDLIKVGGVSGWLRAAAICHAVRMPVSNHFFQEASAHLMAVTPTAQFIEYFDLAGPVLAKSLPARDGKVRADDAPGLGIEWNEAAIAKLLV